MENLCEAFCGRIPPILRLLQKLFAETFAETFCRNFLQKLLADFRPILALFSFFLQKLFTFRRNFLQKLFAETFGAEFRSISGIFGHFAETFGCAPQSSHKATEREPKSKYRSSS